MIADLFIATFKRKTNLIPQTSGGINGGISEGLKKVIAFIEKSPGSNTNKISGMLNKPVKTVEKWLIKLKKENFIEYRGSKKTGGYFIREGKIESGEASIKN